MNIFRNLFTPTRGLIEANVQAYFRSREAGDDHRDALRLMVETRYFLPFDEAKRTYLLEYLPTPDEDPSMLDLVTLVYIMITVETRRPISEDRRLELREDICKAINACRLKYPNVHFEAQSQT